MIESAYSGYGFEIFWFFSEEEMDEVSVLLDEDGIGHQLNRTTRTIVVSSTKLEDVVEVLKEKYIGVYR